MSNTPVEQTVAKPRMPKRPSGFVVNTGTTYRASKAQTLLLRARDARDEAAAAKKATAAEAKKERACLAQRKATAADDRLNRKPKQ